MRIQLDDAYKGLSSEPGTQWSTQWTLTATTTISIIFLLSISLHHASLSFPFVRSWAYFRLPMNAMQEDAASIFLISVMIRITFYAVKTGQQVLQPWSLYWKFWCSRSGLGTRSLFLKSALWLLTERFACQKPIWLPFWQVHDQIWWRKRKENRVGTAFERSVNGCNPTAKSHTEGSWHARHSSGQKLLECLQQLYEVDVLISFYRKGNKHKKLGKSFA